MLSTSSTTTTMELELEESIAIGAGKDVIKRLTDILSGLRMQKEQLELRSNVSSALSSTYPTSVSATILGVPQRQETDLKSLTDLLAIGVDSWNILRIHEAAAKVVNEKTGKKDKKKKGDIIPAKKDVFDGYLNLAVVYMTTGLERRDIRNFAELVSYLKEEQGEFSTRMGHVCFISPPGIVTAEEEPVLDSQSREIDGDATATDPAHRPSLKRSATVTEREATKQKKKKKAAKKRKDILRIRTVSTWWAGGSPKEVTFGTFTDAATIASLLLLGNAWGISAEDLLALCQANLRTVPLEEQYLIDEAQSRRDRHQSLNSTYVNHPSYNLSRGQPNKAICFSYPEAPPRFSSDLLMSVYQPHAAPPMRFGYAMWGSSAMIRPRHSTIMAVKLDEPTPYKGIMILPEATVMEKHVRMLRDMARQPMDVEHNVDADGQEMEPVFLTWLKTHWIHAAAPTLVAETQNVLQTLSEAPLWLERIRFESTTGASSGRANYLLMLYHHFRQSAFLAKRMKRQIDELRATIPPSMTAGLESTGWLGSISEDCDFWFSECDRLCKDTGLLRRFVLEQRELTQSTRGFVLTILASIFIPLSFVATFFGMNTVEINSPNSNWRLKYYFYSALPLVIVTVFTPFFVPPALRWAVRSGANFVSRPVAKFVVITLSLVFFMASELTCLRIFAASNQAYENLDYQDNMTDAQIQAKLAVIHKSFDPAARKCESLYAVNFWFRLVIAFFAIGFCWFEVDHRRTVDPNRKTRAWPVSVFIAHFRYREGWKRMYLYYLTMASFTVGLSLNIPLIYLIPYVFYYWKVGRRMYRKYKARREDQRISKRVKDMEVNGNLEGSL